jgi:hypothetical protein
MMWIDFLEAPLWQPVALVTLLSLAIVVPATMGSIRRARADRSNDNTVTAGLRLAGSALVLIGGFIAIQNFQLEVQHEALVTDELNKAQSLLESASPVSLPLRQQLGEAIKAYGQAIGRYELNRLTGLPHITGARGDARVETVVAGLRKAVDAAALELTSASKGAEARSLRDAWRSLLGAREQRLSYRELLPGSLVLVLMVCAVCTLVIVGAYPAGSSSGLKWMQSITGAVIVATILALQVVIVSPRTAAEHRTHLVTRLIQSVDAALASG